LVLAAQYRVQIIAGPRPSSKSRPGQTRWKDRERPPVPRRPPWL